MSKYRNIFGLSLLLFAVPVLAVIPQFWETRTYDDFSGGELEGLSLTGDGQLVLAPDFDAVFDTGEPVILSAAADSAGRVYLGTGHEGKVFAVDRDGTGAEILDLGELAVLAMAVDDDDTLFVATSPNGRVYRVDPDGAAQTFFDPGALYIWALVFDGEGRLLVGTGGDGIIYRVDPDGDSEVFYDSEETHIISLAVDATGNVVAGGDPKGYLYRISDDGRPFVLHDSEMREVHSVAVAEDGTVYAAVVDGAGSTDSTVATAGSSVSSAASTSIVITNSTPLAAQDDVQTDGSSSVGADNGNAFETGTDSSDSGSMILEVRPDGSVSSIWQSSDEMVFGLLSIGDRLLFSTGTRGRVYRYDTPGRATLLAESSEEQTTRLVAAGDRIVAASSNAGKLFELGSDAGASGTYTSVVKDTSSVSSWGNVAWSGTGVEILTRSGNTASPDPTWSDWSRAAADGTISSPRARFIQWRAELSGDRDDSARLESVTLPYLQQNFRPEVSNVEVLRPGVALRPAQAAAGVANGPNNNNRGGTTGRVVPVAQAQAPRSVIENGVQALRWTSEDDNDDILVHSILYRSGSENDWKVLADGIRNDFHTIAPDTLPDGMYTMRVVASDIGSNPPELALEGEFETRPFSIDNTPPAVTVRPGGIDDGRVRLTVEARDRTSVLKQAEVSVDAGEWTPVFPVDGIIDSTGEDFDFLSVPMGAGEHVVSVRIYDQNDNVGIGSAIVRIPPAGED